MADEYIRRQDAVEALDGKIIVTGRENADAVLQYMKDISNKIKSIEPADVVSTESQEIGYDQCANAMLKMWMDNVVTDGEYNRIMDRLNKLYFSDGEREE